MERASHLLQECVCLWGRNAPGLWAWARSYQSSPAQSITPTHTHMHVHRAWTSMIQFSLYWFRADMSEIQFSQTSPFSFLILRLNSLPSRHRKSSPGWMMPHLAAMARAVLILSPVTMRTVMPALWHFRMASGTCGGADKVLKRENALRGYRIHDLYRTYLRPNGILNSDDSDAGQIGDNFSFILPVRLGVAGKITISDADGSQAFTCHGLDHFLHHLISVPWLEVSYFTVGTKYGGTPEVEEKAARSKRGLQWQTIKKKKGTILTPRSCHALLTFSEQSQRLLCCRVGSFHPAFAPQCSWTCVQSWKCRLCRSSPLGSALSQGHSLSLSPAGSPADHTLSYYQPAWADPLPHPEAERELKWSKGQGEEKMKILEMEKFLFIFENRVQQWILYRVMVLPCWKKILHQPKLAGWSPSLYCKNVLNLNGKIQ